MKIVVINLASALARRRFMAGQLAALGLHYEFINALSPAEISPGTLKELRFNWQRQLRETEVACFLSHVAVWRNIAMQTDPVLVLEDDAILSKRLPEFLEQATKIQDIDHLNLEVHYKKKWLGPRREIGGGFTIAQLHLDRAGAAAYILWPAGAKILLARVDKGEVALADAFIAEQQSWRSYQADPVQALQAEVAPTHRVRTAFQTSSTIQAYDARDNLTAAAYWELKRRRLRAQWQIGLRKMKLLKTIKPRWPKVASADFEIDPYL